MESAGWPVESPSERVELAVGRRRHRWLTMPSGVVLFACMFLPAVQQCDSPVYPVQMPYFWHPYIYGLAFAVASMALTVRGVRNATRLIRVVTWVALAGGMATAALSALVAIVEIMVGFVLMCTIGLGPSSERRIALTAIVVAALSLLWFGLWAGTSGALYGVYVSLGASIGLLAGSLLWLSEI
jgi:hypothetical protein